MPAPFGGNSGRHAVTVDLLEIAISTIPFDVGVLFTKPGAFSRNFEGMVAPVGMIAPVKPKDVIGRALMERAVDRITTDMDVTATEACVTRMDLSIYVNQITKLMRVGLLGKQRKYDPTRWAITAGDDPLPIQMKEEIARYPRKMRSACLTVRLTGTGSSASQSRATGSTR
ncbi:MAG: hypothetical protein WCF90_00765 [Methanomicrobiales archaeon]